MDNLACGNQVPPPSSGSDPLPESVQRLRFDIKKSLENHSGDADHDSATAEFLIGIVPESQSA
jgi:hypothetical protein